MQNNERIVELAVSRHKLAALVQDRVISEELPSLAQKCAMAIAGIEKKIMTFKVTGLKGPRSRNKSNVKNKHKQARD